LPFGARETMTSSNLARCALLTASLVLALAVAAVPASAAALAVAVEPLDECATPSTDLVVVCCPPLPINIHFIRQWVLGCGLA
jgi:hypothetical protein